MICWNLTWNWIDRWTQCEYDGLHFADDWGEQARLMINVRKPGGGSLNHGMHEMFKKVHEAGMDVWYHTDGHINEIYSRLD